MKIEKINEEIEKKRAKVAQLQAEIRGLEQKRTEQENLEIVGLVRGVDLPLDALAELLRSFRQGGAPLPGPEKEDSQDDE